jgi:O-antigen/teichoic acid export membrane protein
MVFTKFISASEVGKFALGLAIVTPIVMFAQLHLRSVQATDAKGLYTLGDYFTLRLLGGVVILIASVAIAALFYGEFYMMIVITLIACAKTIESISDIIYGLFQKNMRMDIIAKSMIAKGVTSLFLLVVAVWLTRSVIWGVLALGICWLFILLIYDVPKATTFEQVKTQFILKNLWGLTRLAAPLGAVMGLICLQSNIPKYFIEANFGKAMLGYFAAVSYVAVVGEMIVMAVGQSAVARLAQYYISNRRAFKILMWKMVLVGLIMGIALIGLGVFFGKWFLGLIYTREYAECYNVFIWLLISCAVAFVGSMFGYAITAARYFKIQVPQNALVVLVGIISAYLLIPRYGLTGGAWTLLIANSVRTLSLGMIANVIKKKQAVSFVVN